jgi:hypothetical protein
MESPLIDSQGQPARRGLPRTLIAGVLLVAVFGLISVILFFRPRQQANLIEQITAVGGFVTHDPPPSLQERIAAYRQGQPQAENYTSVGLYTSEITGEWLREHDDLTALEITDLKLAETTLTDADLARLIAAHPLEVVELRAEKVGMETIAALAQSQKLFILQIRESPIDDGQFARLPLERLEELRIDDTGVTPAGLKELSRAGRLYRLTIDGQQLDDATAEVLSRLPRLRELELIGALVTDDHLARLRAITALEWVTLRRTAVTDDGIKSLKDALPNCEIITQ